MAQATYPCYRCSGEGVIRAFSHVLGGVCFRCGGSGVQSSKPTTTKKWVVLDSAGDHVYNVAGRTANEALSRALKIFAKANSAEFVAQHDMAKANAVPYDEYWTEARLEATRND